MNKFLILLVLISLSCNTKKSSNIGSVKKTTESLINQKVIDSSNINSIQKTTYFLANQKVNDDRIIKNYGLNKINYSINKSIILNISELKDFGHLLKKIEEINCKKSVPVIRLENKKNVKNIYPNLFKCSEDVLFCPSPNQYINVRNNKFYHGKKELNIDKTGLLLERYFSDYQYPYNILVVIKSTKSEDLVSIKRLLNLITERYESLETESTLDFMFE